MKYFFNENVLFSHWKLSLLKLECKAHFKLDLGVWSPWSIGLSVNPSLVIPSHSHSISKPYLSTKKIQTRTKIKFFFYKIPTNTSLLPRTHPHLLPCLFSSASQNPQPISLLFSFFILCIPYPIANNHRRHLDLIALNICVNSPTISSFVFGHQHLSPPSPSCHNLSRTSLFFFIPCKHFFAVALTKHWRPSCLCPGAAAVVFIPSSWMFPSFPASSSAYSRRRRASSHRQVSLVCPYFVCCRSCWSITGQHAITRPFLQLLLMFLSVGCSATNTTCWSSCADHRATESQPSSFATATVQSFVAHSTDSLLYCPWT